MTSSENGITAPAQEPVEATVATETALAADSKGKGKAAASVEETQDASMVEDDDDDEDEDAEENDEAVDEEEEEEDGMEEINPDNVIAGKRTRGKVIDFAKAAKENPPQEDDDDEEDDDDFQGEGEDDKMDED